MKFLNFLKMSALVAFLLFQENIHADDAMSQGMVPNTSMKEVSILEAQLESNEKYQGQIISIVTWSLGSVVAMALGLAAFNWYSTKISYDREIQALSLESEAHQKNIETRLTRYIDEISHRLEAGLNSREGGIKQALVTEMRKEIAVQRDIISSYKSRILDLEFDNTQRHAEEAIRNGPVSWGIYKYCELMGISVEKGSDNYEVGEIMDEISKALDNPKMSMSSDDVSNTIASLRKLPERHRAAAENLIRKVNKTHVNT